MQILQEICDGFQADDTMQKSATHKSSCACLYQSNVLVPEHHASRTFYWDLALWHHRSRVMKQAVLTAGGKSDINRRPKSKNNNKTGGASRVSMTRMISPVACHLADDKPILCKREERGSFECEPVIPATKIEVACSKKKNTDINGTKQSTREDSDESALIEKMPARLLCPNAAHSLFAPSENKKNRINSTKDYGDLSIFGVESPNNDESEGSDEEERSQENAVTMDPKQVNGQGRLLLVSLLENFCDLYDQDPDKNRRMFLALCRRLSSMGVC
jgi:hypothetical protein